MQVALEGHATKILKLEEQDIVRAINIDEAIPLNSREQSVEEDPDFDSPIWVQQNVLRIRKELGGMLSKI